MRLGSLVSSVIPLVFLNCSVIYFMFTPFDLAASRGRGDDDVAVALRHRMMKRALDGVEGLERPNSGRWAATRTGEDTTLGAMYVFIGSAKQVRVVY